MERLETKARHRIEEMVPKEEIVAGRTVSTAVWGEANEQMIKYAVEHNIDLIVCGTRGRLGWDHFRDGKRRRESRANRAVSGPNGATPGARVRPARHDGRRSVPCHG
jgi:hypothetical protein